MLSSSEEKQKEIEDLINIKKLFVVDPLYNNFLKSPLPPRLQAESFTYFQSNVLICKAKQSYTSSFNQWFIHILFQMRKPDAFTKKVIDVKIAILDRVDYPTIWVCTKKIEFKFISSNSNPNKCKSFISFQRDFFF